MQSNMTQMLQMMDRPAFFVLDGIICDANQAALGRMIEVGTSIAPLLSTGKAEYEAFTGGWMYLTVSPGGVSANACVRRVDAYDVFVLEPENTAAEYQALALAAQELRTPLGRILSMTDWLFPSLDLPEGSPAAEQVNRINRGLHQMLRIINNMSDAARYTTSAPVLHTRDVNAVLAEFFEQAAPLCEYSGIHLEYSGLPAPVFSQVDSEQLERCVYSILSNALKHTPSGGTVSAALTKKGNTLYLTVTDTGTGIDPEKMGDVFTRFLREPSVNDSGLGLGMTLIRACANTHGGTVLIAPSDGKGMKLTISLPIQLDTTQLSSPKFTVDYTGGRSLGMIELSEHLPHKLYQPK